MLKYYILKKNKLEDGIFEYFLSKEKIKNENKYFYIDGDEKELNEIKDKKFFKIISFTKDIYYFKDFVFSKNDIKKVKKQYLLYLLQMRMKNDANLLLSINGIYFLKYYFLQKNIKFESKTMEDDYLSILNSNNEEDINLLQKYLVINDMLQNLKFKIKNVFEYIYDFQDDTNYEKIIKMLS